MSQNIQENVNQGENDNVQGDNNLVAGCNGHDIKGECEALLIGDGTPPWLTTLLSTLKEPARYRGDAFVSALIVLMYESGFYLNDGPSNHTASFDIRIMRCLTKYPCHLIDDSHYELTFYFESSENKCILVIIPIDDVAIVNLVIPDCTTISLSFNMNNYVSINRTTPSILNGPKLSISFKNALSEIISFFPGQPYPDHIFSLPVEILICICQYLNPISFFKFSSTCKHLYYTLYDEELIWKHIARQYFPSRNLRGENWKDFVIYQYKLQIENQRKSKQLAYEPVCSTPDCYTYHVNFPYYMTDWG